MKKPKDSSKGIKPNKQQRRPGAGDPSPAKRFKLGAAPTKPTLYRKQGR